MCLPKTCNQTIPELISSLTLIQQTMAWANSKYGYIFSLATWLARSRKASGSNILWAISSDDQHQPLKVRRFYFPDIKISWCCLFFIFDRKVIERAESSCAFTRIFANFSPSFHLLQASLRRPPPGICDTLSADMIFMGKKVGCVCREG